MLRPHIKCQIVRGEENRRCQNKGYYPYFFMNVQGDKIMVYICGDCYDKMHEYEAVL